MKILKLTAICLFSFALQAQQLTIDRIMEGHKFVGYLPEDIFWSEDGSKIYFQWNPNQEKETSLYFVQVKNGKALGKPQKASIEEQKNLPASTGEYSKDYSKYLYMKDGDIFLYEKGKVKQITQTSDFEHSPAFTGDEKSIVYTKNNNLYEWSLLNNQLKQLTDFRAGDEDDEKKLAKEEQWLEDQQTALIQVIKERKEQTEAHKKLLEELKPERAKEIYLDGKQVEQVHLSPDRQYVTFRLRKDAKPKRTAVPNYVTGSGYVDDINARPKVGHPQSTYQLGIYQIKKDTVLYLDMKQLDGISDIPEYYKEYHRDTVKTKKIREVIPTGVYWSQNGRYAVLIIRSQDNKDRWITLLDAETAKLKLLDRQRDEAWIGGPGIDGWNMGSGNVGWMPDNKNFYFQSEKTGFSHLYTVNVETGKTEALTSGKFEVTDAFISRDEKKWYLTTNEVHPGEYHFYTMGLNGGKRTQITSETGMYEVFLSPDEKYMAVHYSYSNKPWELYLMPVQAGAKMTQLTESLNAEFKKYKWYDPQIVTFKASDGVEVYARLYKPANTQPKGKAVIFVHGAGYLQNVHKGWSSYFREYMFHNFLMQNGYTVLDIDYRASKGYGRDFRTGIYRYMGGKDLDDQVDGTKFLVEKYDIDPKKIGIYGGSYGGFITLMGMFTKPNVFRAGAALRSVTDWAHYNHGYTSNILNTPVLDSIAYARSSPIYFAEGLKGNLLICHGVIDDNVQFQDVVRLAQRLIELRKENWEFAVYPVEPHGFVEPTSWADEYKRIFKLFEENLK